MKDIVIKFLEGFPALTKEEVIEIAENLIVRSYKKDTILLNAGSVQKRCYYVLSGCVRQYKIVNGVDKTIEFFTDRNGAVTSIGFINKTPSDYFLSCIEDTVILIGDPDQDQKMYKKFPVLESITRMMMEQEWGKTKEALASFVLSSPEERYLDLIKNRPELFKLAPQHHIASYLGVTPESLSRIRKRIISRERI